MDRCTQSFYSTSKYRVIPRKSQPEKRQNEIVDPPILLLAAIGPSGGLQVDKQKVGKVTGSMDGHYIGPTPKTLKSIDGIYISNKKKMK